MISIKRWQDADAGRAHQGKRRAGRDRNGRPITKRSFDRALLYWLWGFWCLAAPVVIGAAAAVMRLDEQKQHKDPKR